MQFKLNSPYQPSGDQPQAIQQLTEGLLNGERYQTLLGVTGSGKTFTMKGTAEKLGIIPLAVQHIFSHIEQTVDRSRVC